MIKEGKNKKTYKVITKEVDNTLNEKDMSAIDYIQYKYPETARAFQDFQFAQWELFCKKQKDYGPSNISVGTNLETEDDIRLALTGLWFRSNDKMQRFKQIVLNDQDPENESLMDTFMDLANYSIIAQLVSEGSWGK
jgi:hypothetical protein